MPTYVPELESRLTIWLLVVAAAVATTEMGAASVDCTDPSSNNAS